MTLRCSRQGQVASRGACWPSLVPHLRLQLLEEVLDHDDSTGRVVDPEETGRRNEDVRQIVERLQQRDPGRTY